MPKKRPNLTIETGSTSGSTTSDVNKTLTSMNNMKLEDTVIAAGGENTLSARVSETNTGGRGSAASSVSNLEIKRSPSSMFGFDLTSKKNMTMDEFEKLEELGVGNGGVVTKVKVKKTGKVMAQKLVRLEVKKEIHKRIVNELKLLEQCQHPNIVDYYYTFVPPQAQEIVICMEHMDGKSLDMLLKVTGRFPERIISVVAISVLKGCRFLHEEKKVMHRDIKPSNILVNSQGKVKLCDFGVSANLINSIANSFVGTRSYMAPERLTGSQEYTIKSDVWALGITLIELAIGFYPIPGQSRDKIQQHIARSPYVDASNEGMFKHSFMNNSYSRNQATGIFPTQTMAIFELLENIVTADPPQLYEEPGNFSKPFVEYCNSCLYKDMPSRPTFVQLNDMEFIQDNLADFADNTVYFANFIRYAIKYGYEGER